MKWLQMVLAFSMVIFNVSSAAASEMPNNGTYEAKSMHAFLTYCLPALLANDSVSRVAEMMKLPELGKPAEEAFLKGRPGKVFGLPEVGSGIVLSAPDAPMCSIIIQKLDAKEWVAQADNWFDPKNTPFVTTKNVTLPSGEINREYKAKFKDTNVLVIFSTRPQPVEGGIQAMITAGRATD